MNYITGNTIRTLREKKKMTQKQLADQLSVSDKTISKWETDKGLPDIGIVGELAEALGVSMAELLTGDIVTNQNRSSNIRKSSFYVCPVCGNVIQAVGEGAFSCCGIALPKLEAEEGDEQHSLKVDFVDGEYYVSIGHEMTKEHYISFFAYASSSCLQLVKLYPEQTAECRFARRGHGSIYAFCNRHGLYEVRI